MRRNLKFPYRSHSISARDPVDGRSNLFYDQPALHCAVCADAARQQPSRLVSAAQGRLSARLFPQFQHHQQKSGGGDARGGSSAATSTRPQSHSMAIGSECEKRRGGGAVQWRQCTPSSSASGSQSPSSGIDSSFTSYRRKAD